MIIRSFDSFIKKDLCSLFLLFKNNYDITKNKVNTEQKKIF